MSVENENESGFFAYFFLSSKLDYEWNFCLMLGWLGLFFFLVQVRRMRMVGNDDNDGDKA